MFASKSQSSHWQSYHNWKLIALNKLKWKNKKDKSSDYLLCDALFDAKLKSAKKKEKILNIKLVFC